MGYGIDDRFVPSQIEGCEDHLPLIHDPHRFDPAVRVHWAVQPPSIRMSVPVTKPAASEQR